MEDKEFTKDALENKSEELSWYLRGNALTWFSILVPPLAYFIIFLNYKKLSPNVRSNSLFFTNLMMAGWVIKLLPQNTFTFILVCLMVAFSLFLIVVKLKLMMKD